MGGNALVAGEPRPPHAQEVEQLPLALGKRLAQVARRRAAVAAARRQVIAGYVYVTAVYPEPPTERGPDPFRQCFVLDPFVRLHRCDEGSGLAKALALETGGLRAHEGAVRSVVDDVGALEASSSSTVRYHS